MNQSHVCGSCFWVTLFSNSKIRFLLITYSVIIFCLKFGKVVLWRWWCLLRPIICTRNKADGVYLWELNPYFRSIYASSIETWKNSERSGRRASHGFENCKFRYQIWKQNLSATNGISYSSVAVSLKYKNHPHIMDIYTDIWIYIQISIAHCFLWKFVKDYLSKLLQNVEEIRIQLTVAIALVAEVIFERTWRKIE